MSINKSKGVTDLNVKPKATKHPEGNIGENFCGLGLKIFRYNTKSIIQKKK